MKKLLLFDIDGTILITRGIGQKAVEDALEELFGQPLSTHDVSFSGKTDPQILREVLELNGFSVEAIENNLPPLLEVYSKALTRYLEGGCAELLPGVRPLIEHLSEQNHVQLGLLTGNLKEMAYRKLEAVGLADYFPFGAFGSDDADRYKLPSIAVQRAREYTGRRFHGRDVVIIGDTEHDIGCGRGIGALSVAVCTGRFARDYLETHSPDVLFDDLSCLDSFVSEVFGVAA